MGNENKDFVSAKDVIFGLIEKCGEEAVVKAMNTLTLKAGRPIPAEHIPVLDAHKLQETILQLDTAVGEILEAGKANEAAYQNKADLKRRFRTLDTEIKLAESEAIMDIQGNGKDAFVMIGDKKTALTNEQSRDAYRRMASKKLREEQASVEADLDKIDVNIARAKESYNAKQEASQNIRIKANLQAALLNFLR